MTNLQKIKRLEKAGFTAVEERSEYGSMELQIYINQCDNSLSLSEHGYDSVPSEKLEDAFRDTQCYIECVCPNIYVVAD